jgi:hypothetical protein
MLRAAKYRLRYNRKRLTRTSAPDREQQFRKIERLRHTFRHRGQPVISVDAKKRELVGRFKNHGRVWSKTPVDVNVYDFPSDAEGVAIPYGIYDVTRDEGTVVVGTSHNTPAFATNAIYTWWTEVGRICYRGARELLILADSGSSNGAKAHDWKAGLQEFANRTGLQVTVAHYPTGASKWNPVEHRLFGPISINWAGQPLTDYNTICNLIRNTHTGAGRCHAFLDRGVWPTKKEAKAAALPEADRHIKCRPPLNIRHARDIPHRNYTIRPQRSDEDDHVI